MEKSIVSIVRIENNDIDKAVRKAVELAGGLPKQVDKKVLIKPNILTFKKTDQEQLKVTTHPEVIRSLIQLAKEQNYKIVVGDQSGGSLDTTRVIRKSGLAKLREEEQVPVISLAKEGSERIKIKDYIKLEEAVFTKLALESAIINVPKMKTHTLTRVTLAIKNLFGCIPGMEKSRIHAVGGTAKGFSECLVDIYSVLKDNIVMNVMDATIAMEGHGPSNGQPVKTDLILASKDAVALDAVATMVMGEKPKTIFTTKIAEEHGLGTATLENIEIVGENIEEVRKKFNIPGRFVALLPIGRFFELLRKQPKYKGSGCITCLQCEKICPVEAVIVDKKKREPVFNYKNCISCFSCQEMCPEAVIEIKRLKYKNHFIISGVLAVLLFAVIITLVSLL
ncbi:MAG: DUF362 domain-containing protein [Candidatus Heimdallarchaeaceae archaeon]